MTVGILNVISALEMGVITYAFATYELSIQQAVELTKGVDASIERQPEILQQNGMRQTIFKIPAHYELMVCQEVEVGYAILPVNEESVNAPTRTRPIRR